MPNPFDTLGEVNYEPQYQMGFLKKLGKKIGKAVKSVKKTVQKIEKKTTPKKFYEAKTKVKGKVKDAVKNNKLVQGAVIAVASVYGTPAAGAAVKGAFAAQNVANAVKASKKSKKDQKSINNLYKDPRYAEQARLMESQGFSADEILKSFQQKPIKMDKRTATKKRREAQTGTQSLRPVVDEMRESGFTEEQINKAWVNSDAYKEAAIKAAQSEAGSVAANLIAQGMPQQQAQSLAPQIATQQAAQAVEDIRESTAPNNMPLLLGIGLVGAFFLMKKKG